jgi:hypothetical protein
LLFAASAADLKFLHHQLRGITNFGSGALVGGIHITIAGGDFKEDDLASERGQLAS